MIHNDDSSFLQQDALADIRDTRRSCGCGHPHYLSAMPFLRFTRAANRCVGARGRSYRGLDTRQAVVAARGHRGRRTHAKRNREFLPQINGIHC